MPRVYLSDLLRHLPVAIMPETDPAITAPVTEDTRLLQPGGVFVARVGAAFDGHEFIPQAVARGAAAVVGQRPPEAVACAVPYAAVPDAWAALGTLAAAYHGFPSRDLAIVGITGTDGKTTTSAMLHTILQAAGMRAGMINTLGVDLGGRDLPTGLHVTTPTAPEVHAFLAEMRDAGLTHAVLEATSHGLAQGRLDGVDVDVAVVTNITHEHLDYHGTWEAYRDAKALLFRRLGESARKVEQPKVSVINADDSAADFLRAIPADRVLTYALAAADADLRAAAVRFLPDATTFTVARHEVRLPLVGAFNVYNALAAFGAALALGVEAADIAHGLAAVKPVPGRMERIDAGQDFLAIVDFAHTPHSLAVALAAARTMTGPGGRVICVVGSAGLRDRAKRRLMAEVAGRLADLTVLTAEDPRTESLDAILDEMAAGCESVGGVEGETFARVPDRGRALAHAVELARAGDVVIACGKGHEQSMCFGTTEYPWDDREALRAALNGVPLLTLPTAGSGH